MSDFPLIKQVAKQHSSIIIELADLSPFQTSASFAALLITPELQANCHCLEMLVHLALAYGSGRKSPKRAFISRAFDQLRESYCGLMEDPAEDVFVSLVSTSEGNFRVFEGIREALGFHLQRVLNVLENMPNESKYDLIRRKVGCLLRLSETIAARANIREYVLGQERPLNRLSATVLDQLPDFRQFTRFSRSELTNLGIDLQLLSEFFFEVKKAPELRNESIFHSQLGRRPIVLFEQAVHLLLPTAVGSAITRFVVEQVYSFGLANFFEQALAHDYQQLFDQTPKFHIPFGALQFQQIEGGLIGSTMTEVDVGRYLHWICFVDSLENFLDEGLMGTSAHPDALAAGISSLIEGASNTARQQLNFREGVSVLVGCGLGRSLSHGPVNNLPQDWRFVAVTAHDLVTLGWLPNFDVLSFWRLLDTKAVLEQRGVHLLNVNGLLNLVAWSRELKGHLVPQEEMAQEIAESTGPRLVVVNQNALRTLRYEVLTEWDPRRVQDPEGNWVPVKRLDDSFFQEDRSAPLYANFLEWRQQRYRAMYRAARYSWWIEAKFAERTADLFYEYWKMLYQWLQRAAPILDEVCQTLARDQVTLNFIFPQVGSQSVHSALPTVTQELPSLMKTSANGQNAYIEIKLLEEFISAFQLADNRAERAIVEAMVSGVSEIDGFAWSKQKQTDLVNRICPNREARFIHHFQAHSFRMLLGDRINGRALLIDPMAEAAVKLGLGWRSRSRELGNHVTGQSECTSYLNSVVGSVLDELCSILRTLNCRELLTKVLLNYEKAVRNRDTWRWTAQANLALHHDKSAAIRTITEHEAQLNACLISSRVLLEAAICECTLEGGVMAGNMEISHLLALAGTAFHLGNWSDAIRWGAMEAHVRITPFGDVQMNHTFSDTVYDPFARLGATERIYHEASSYAKHYEQTSPIAKVVDTFEPQFLKAWQAEFGVSIERLRDFLEELEQACIQLAEPFAYVLRSELGSSFAKSAHISIENALYTLDLLTLTRRPSWRPSPPEFQSNAWYPWRFSRQLSVLRRPFLQLEQVNQVDDPTILYAPGLIREAISLTLTGFHLGEVHVKQAKSPEMSSWIGDRNYRHRISFNSKVAERMQEIGWKVEKEVKLTKLTGCSLDRDYGDIDVLAWNPVNGRVLLIECKDLQPRRTLGEVAEELADFRGERKPDGKPDKLMKHLTRVEVLNKYRRAVEKNLQIQSDIQMEGHLVFSSRVPMQFAWDKLAGKLQLSLYSELDQI